MKTGLGTKVWSTILFWSPNKNVLTKESDAAFVDVCLNDVAFLRALVSSVSSRRRETVCNFIALSELRPPRQEFTTLLPTQNNPGSPNSNSLQNHFATPTFSLSLRLGLLFDRSHSFTSNPVKSKESFSFLKVFFHTKSKPLRRETCCC